VAGIVATLSPQSVPAWASVVGAFSGGLDCVYWANRTGCIVGILQIDRGGRRLGFNVVVHPRYRRRGIATKLLVEALIRWPALDIRHERYTPASAAWISSLLAKEATNG